MSTWSITLEPDTTTYGQWTVVKNNTTTTTATVASSGGSASLPNLSAGDTVTVHFDPDEYELSFDCGDEPAVMAIFTDALETPQVERGQLRSGQPYTVTLQDISRRTISSHVHFTATVLRIKVGPSTIKGSLNVSGN